MEKITVQGDLKGTKAYDYYTETIRQNNQSNTIL